MVMRFGAQNDKGSPYIKEMTYEVRRIKYVSKKRAEKKTDEISS